MSTAVPSLPLQLGQLVRRRSEPAGTAGFVAGLLFVEPTLVLVRWDDGGSSFEPEDTLVEIFRLRGRATTRR
jgi:hypothetical protein